MSILVDIYNGIMFPSLSHAKFSNSIPNEPLSTSSWAVGKITCAVINTSNGVKWLLLRIILNLLLFSFRKNIGQHSEECMCRLRNIALESVTDGQTDRQMDRKTDGRTTDKVIPMCRYASQATQKESLLEAV